MIIKNAHDVPATAVKMEGASNVSVRVIFGPVDKAPTFAMRIFELEPGGHTPYHSHPFEHEVVILSGDIVVVGEQGPQSLKPEQMLLIGPNEKHQFKNPSVTQIARFMCLVPIDYQK